MKNILCYLTKDNVYHNLGLLKIAVRCKQREFYVHNTPEVRQVFGMLQKYGWIGRFIAVASPPTPSSLVRAKKTQTKTNKKVHEPFEPAKAKKLATKSVRSHRNPPYLLVFNKFRINNKHLPVIGDISWYPRPLNYKRPYKASKMINYRQGMGMEFVRLDNGTFQPAHMCQLSGKDGYKGFKISS